MLSSKCFQGLTYENAQNLQDLWKLERLEELDTLKDEIDFLSLELKELRRMYKKEQTKRVYGNIRDDSIYQGLLTHKSDNESDVPFLASDNRSKIKWPQGKDIWMEIFGIDI